MPWRKHRLKLKLAGKTVSATATVTMTSGMIVGTSIPLRAPLEGLASFEDRREAVPERITSEAVLLEPYNWGPQGEPEGTPFRYVPGEGWGTGNA